ncbi:MAG: hypothetical protein ACETWG_07890 [Candidatus Neomarinimicrobiota bacterium]
MGGTSAASGVILVTYSVPTLKAVSYVPVFILGACLVPLALLSVFVLSGYVERVVPREIRGSG